MLQETFNNYAIATSIASVNLTDELIKDIQTGERKTKINGKIVTLREKEIAAYFLNRYSVILQEYTLVDIANSDYLGVQADNRLTREEMKLVLKGVNKFSGLGLNSSEDFVLDRVVLQNGVNLGVELLGRSVDSTSFRISLVVDDAVEADSTFTVNVTNAFGLEGTSTEIISILAGATEGSVLTHSEVASLDSYSASFELDISPSGFKVGLGQITIPVSGVE